MRFATTYLLLPLTALTPRASQAIRAEHGLSIEMIEKDFHVASRDDPAIVSIVEGLALPLSPAQMPPRPQLPPVSARPVRPTAQQMFRSKASGAAAAARRAALLEARAEEAAARMGDTLLDARDADAAAIAAASAAQRAIADETADEGESGDEAGAPPPAAPAAAAGASSDAAADGGSEAASDTGATGGEATDDEGADSGGGAAADSGGAAPMEIDGAQQAADASDTDDRPAGAADVGGAAPAQATESDASSYTEDLPIAAYQPVVTNVLQPLEHAGEDGDTEAAGGGARLQRGKRLGGRARKRAQKKAARETATLPAVGGDDSGAD